MLFKKNKEINTTSMSTSCGKCPFLMSCQVYAEVMRFSKLSIFKKKRLKLCPLYYNQSTHQYAIDTEYQDRIIQKIKQYNLWTIDVENAIYEDLAKEEK